MYTVAGLVASIKVLAGALAKRKEAPEEKSQQAKSGDLAPAEWDQRIQLACERAVKITTAPDMTSLKESMMRLETSNNALSTALNKLTGALSARKGISGDD